ncbi:MAG TPA: hypothetical protein VHY08_14415 [Bacillota bacterium]|nr:hypothetical protein [Bacillota bacterium]
MKSTRRLGLALIAVFVCLILFFHAPSFGACPASGARTVNDPAAVLKSNLEAKYGLKLLGDRNLLTGKDALSYLAAFDKAMSLFGAPFVRELVGIYQKTGETPKVRFSKYTGRDDEDAFYDWGDEGVVIGLMVESPYPGKPTMGLAPQTVTHEIGHMIYYSICEKYGAEKFEMDWIAVNDGNPYREGNPDHEWEENGGESDSPEPAIRADDERDKEPELNYVYVSEYAAYDAFEDFAEIIAYILTEPEQIREWTMDWRGAVLKAKVDFIEKMLKKYFTTFKGYSSWGTIDAGIQSPTKIPTLTSKEEPARKPDSAMEYQ